MELVGGIVIDQLHKVIRVYTLIVSFMPAISALSGNLGLQASANTIRGLGTGGHAAPSTGLGLIWYYCRAY